MDKLLRDKKAIFIFLAPALILFTVVLFIPICQSVYYSFCEYKGLTAPKFIGLTNYKNLLKDKSFDLNSASVLGVVLLLIACVFILIYSQIMKNMEEDIYE